MSETLQKGADPEAGRQQVESSGLLVVVAGPNGWLAERSHLGHCHGSNEIIQRWREVFLRIILSGLFRGQRLGWQVTCMRFWTYDLSGESMLCQIYMDLCHLAALVLLCYGET
jgi:hypothetical protein